MLDLILLFTAALVAATLVPAGSEAMLAGLYLKGAYDPVILIMVATCGNVLGSCINWLLGRYLEHFKDRSWFPAKEAALDRARRTYQHYGVWTLLFSWVPVIGDPLTLIAGLLRTPFPLFLILVGIGKLGRYIAVIAAL